MIAYSPARSGELAVSCDGRWIHSRYDPRTEARRFVERETPANGGYRTVVILGDGLGYLVDAVRERLPTVPIVWLNYHRDLFDHRVADADAMWSGEGPPDRFLDQTLLDDESSTLLVLAWEPAARAFPDVAERCLAALRTVLDRRTAVLATEGYFGRRWLRNAVRTALALCARGSAERHPAVQKAVSADSVVIAASGPSLTRSLSDLASLPNTTQIWALPSAVSILLNAGIRPDLVVATDGGAYAIEHLKPLRGLGVPVAAPLSAALDRPEDNFPIVLLDQGSWFERDLVSLLHTSAIALPPHGTVAGSAWYLASAIGVRAVSFVGLDLCTADLHAHPPGHRFERILWPLARRTNPLYTTLYRRSVVDSDAVPGPSHGRARMSRSMRVYARWFAEVTLPTPAVRIHPSPVAIAIPAGELPHATGARRSVAETPSVPSPSGVPSPSSVPYSSGVPSPSGVPHGERSSATPSAADLLRPAVERWTRALDELPTAIRRPARERSREGALACDIARTIETAHYLTVLRHAESADAEALAATCLTTLAHCIRRLTADGSSGARH